jgi:hypothetical protein
MEKLHRDALEPELSDDALAAILNQQTVQMLRFIKTDHSLVQKFHDAEAAVYCSDDEEPV